MRRLLAVVFAVAACGGGGQGGTDRTPDRTKAPVSTPSPWPAAYEDKVCSALVQLSGAGDDLIALAKAAGELDVDRVSLMAYAAGGYFLGIQATLTDVPSWTPGNLLVDRLREIAAGGIAASELIDEGASELDAAMMNEGSERLLRIEPLVKSATAALEGLERNRGFSC